MHNIEISEDEPRGRSFAWLVPFLFVVVALVLSWTGMFIVISDLIKAAATASMTGTVHE